MDGPRGTRERHGRHPHPQRHSWTRQPDRGRLPGQDVCRNRGVQRHREDDVHDPVHPPRPRERGTGAVREPRGVPRADHAGGGTDGLRPPEAPREGPVLHPPEGEELQEDDRGAAPPAREGPLRLPDQDPRRHRPDDPGDLGDAGQARTAGADRETVLHSEGARRRPLHGGGAREARGDGRGGRPAPYLPQRRRDPPRVLPDRRRVQPDAEGPEDAGDPSRGGRVPVHLRPGDGGRRPVLCPVGPRDRGAVPQEGLRGGVPYRGGAEGPANHTREDQGDERAVGLRLLPRGGPPGRVRLVRPEAVRPVMPSLAGKVDKTMEAESVGLLKHMLDTELRRSREENGFDLVLFLGVDGRIFASDVPWTLDPRQYRLLNLVKGNLNHICNQLSGQNMKLSIQQYDVGTIIISGVGDKAFLVCLTAHALEVTQMRGVLNNVLNVSAVMKHLLEQRGMSQDDLSAYSPEVAGELKKLSRALFVEKFEETRGYKRNMEVLAFVKKRLQAVVGIGPLEEILTMAFNEVGTSAPYMTESPWERFLDLVIAEVGKLSGEVAAARARREWTPEGRKLLKSFV